MNETTFALILSLFIFSTVGISQTGGKYVNLDEDFSLAASEKAFIKSESFTIEFLYVVEDSRCPPDVNCIWAGNAKVKVLLKKGDKPAKEFELNTNLEPKIIELEGLKIQLTSLCDDPEWKSENKSSKYIAGFVIQKQ